MLYKQHYRAAMVTLGRPHCALIRMPSHPHVLSMLKVPLFSVLCNPSVYWQRHCVAAEMLAVVLGAHQHSASYLDAVRMLL